MLSPRELGINNNSGNRNVQSMIWLHNQIAAAMQRLSYDMVEGMAIVTFDVPIDGATELNLDRLFHPGKEIMKKFIRKDFTPFVTTYGWKSHMVTMTRENGVARFNVELQSINYKETLTEGHETTETGA